jgi:nitrogen-specific signal transduction histidine kinase
VSIDRSDAKLDRAAHPDDPRVLVRLAAARDGVLRGLVHALSNRVGTIGAVAGMLDPEAPAAGVAASVLQGEGERLERLLEEFRRLASEPSATPEPVHLPDLLDGVVALHAHHPVLRDVACPIDGAAALPPVLAEPAAVADALLAALDAAKGAALAAGGDAVRLVGTLEGDAVRVQAVADVVDVAGAAEAEALAWALPGGAGTAWLGARGGGVSLPTLASGRRAG